MRIKTVQASSIKSVFEVLKDIITDVNFVFDEKGISMRTLDTAKVTFMNIHLNASNFEVYECPERVVCGMNIANTFKLLKVIGNNDTLEMSVGTDATIRFEVQNAQKKSLTVFNMKLMEINEDEYSLNDIDFDVQTNIPSMYFQRIIRDMYNFSSHVTITREKNLLRFQCDGDFVNQMTEVECPDVVEGTYTNQYSLKYINMFAKATNICSTVTIKQTHESPIVFTYFIANLGTIEFYLAPISD
jgi:proliferating cell nuclear antigen